MLCTAYLHFRGLPSRTVHTALWTGSFWVVSQMLEAGCPDPPTLSCLSTWPKSPSLRVGQPELALGYLLPIWWSVYWFTWEMNLWLTCSVTGQTKQRPVKTAGSRDTSRTHRTRGNMVLTAGQWEQQWAQGQTQPLAAISHSLILWLLQYLPCHPSNGWLVWNLLLLINKSSFVISCNHINSMMVPTSVSWHSFIHLSIHLPTPQAFTEG